MKHAQGSRSDMQAVDSRPKLRRLAALALILGMALCLLALLLHPVAPHAVAVAPILLLPVLLFGLVLVPRSLWPAFELGQQFALPIRARASLFQRPPPISLL